MDSVPYDPGLFVPIITLENYESLTDDATTPMANRALLAQAPGSTFKIASALAVRDANTTFNCSGALELPGGNTMKCWISAKGGQHGEIGLAEAVSLSCNCYFYQAGIEAGMERLHETAALLGLGRVSGIELRSEQSGNVLNAAYLRSQDRRHRPAMDANMAVGQGDSEATPLQMAAAVSAIGKGGQLHAPRLFLDRVASEPENILRQGIGVGEDVLEAVRQALWRAVNEPGHVGNGAKSEALAIAGKTGTAQFVREGKPDNIGWFVSFAPFENPRYAMAVMVQGAKSGGRVCAPLTRIILERFADLDAGTEMLVVEPLKPAKGHLDPIEAIKP